MLSRRNFRIGRRKDGAVVEYNLHRYVYNSQYFNFSFFCLVLSQDTKTPVPYTWKIGGDVFVEYMVA